MLMDLETRRVVRARGVKFNENIIPSFNHYGRISLITFNFFFVAKRKQNEQKIGNFEKKNVTAKKLNSDFNHSLKTGHRQYI